MKMLHDKLVVYTTKTWEATMNNRVGVVLQVFFVLLPMLMAIPSGVVAQEVGKKLWENSYGDTVGNDVGYGVAIDSAGNTLAAGGVLKTFSNPFYKTTALAVRYSSGGVQDSAPWPLEYDSGGTFGKDYFYSVAVDENDNIVLSGVSEVSVTFTVWKYSKTGVVAWTPPKEVFTGKVGRGYSIFVDSGNNTYSAGYVVDPTGSGNGDWVWVKYASDGSVAISPKAYDHGKDNIVYPSVFDQAQGITVDSHGNIIVTGQVVESGTNAGDADYDWHIRSYTAAGVHRADTTLAQGALSDVAYGVAVDSHDDIYVVGYENGGTTNTTGAGANFNWVVKKLKGSDLSQVWSTSYATTKNEIAYCVAVDEKNNIYVGGYSTDGSDDTHWRLEYRSGGSGTLLKERTWDDLPGSAIRGCSLRDNKLALTGSYSNGTDLDWYTALYDVYTFPWAMFKAATSTGNGTR